MHIHNLPVRCPPKQLLQLHSTNWAHKNSAKGGTRSMCFHLSTIWQSDPTASRKDGGLNDLCGPLRGTGPGKGRFRLIMKGRCLATYGNRGPERLPRALGLNGHHGLLLQPRTSPVQDRRTCSYRTQLGAALGLFTHAPRLRRRAPEALAREGGRRGERR